MKSITEINAEIASLTLHPAIGLFADGLQREEPKKRDANKAAKRLEFLYLVRDYLETKPSEEYMRGEADRIRTLIANISKITVDKSFYPPSFAGDKAKYFNTKMGIDKMREQIKTIEFILD